MKRRLAIFAHYDKDNIIDDYVVYYLNELKKIAKDIVFVSVSNPQNLDVLEDITNYIVVRENIGYDFMSWQRGLEHYGELNDIDELIFCNDSCYGPISPLTHMFTEMEARKLDCWGVSDSCQISEHIQSYFLVFSKVVFSSPVFGEFINNISVRESKEDIVLDYEVGLSLTLRDSGFKLGAFISYKDILEDLSISKIYKDKLMRIFRILRMALSEKGTLNKIDALSKVFKKYLVRVREFSVKENSNIKFVAWEEMLKSGDIFPKVMLLRDDPSDLDAYDKIISVIRDKYKYDISLIENHLSRVKK